MNQPLTILFDGRCNLCLATVEALRAAEFDSPPRFVDSNGADVLKQFPQLNRDDLLGQMWVVGRDGATSGGYDALVNIAATRPSMQPFVPLLRWHPVRQMGWSIYRWVAKHRYRLFGMNGCDNGACTIK